MAGAGEIDWMLISLRRTPERLAAFEAANAGVVDLRYELLEAVDGQLVDREQLVRDGLMEEGLDWSPGAIGAALSHRVCWESAVATGRSVGILEDDVYLRHDFVQRTAELDERLDGDWDLIQFGFNTDTVARFEIFPGCSLHGDYSNKYPSVVDCERFAASRGPVNPTRIQMSFGNCCYAVSPAGAKRLLDRCFPLLHRTEFMPWMDGRLLAKSKDILMNGIYWDMKAYASLPPIAMPLNDKAISTVGSL